LLQRLKGMLAGNWAPPSGFSIGLFIAVCTAGAGVVQLAVMRSGATPKGGFHALRSRLQSIPTLSGPAMNQEDRRSAEKLCQAALRKTPEVRQAF
jgi:hypothetical protein